jgi:flagellar biosynthesis chaperone FliJ
MNQADLMRQYKTFDAMRIMRQAEMEQTLLDLADALNVVDESHDKLAKMCAQRSAIAQAYARQASEGQRLSLYAMEQLRRQFGAADELTQTYDAAHAEACAHRDTLKSEAAVAQSRVEALDDCRKSVQRALMSERDRLASIQLDDLWLGRLAFEGRRP